MRYNEIKTKLMEINMSPSSLKTLASNINATVGIEFEMYVPAFENGDDQDLDPNFIDVEDDSLYSRISDQKIINFFTSGEDTNSAQDVKKVISKIRTRFEEYLQEKTKEEVKSRLIGYLEERIRDDMYDIYASRAEDEFKKQGMKYNDDDLEQKVTELIAKDAPNFEQINEDDYKEYYAELWDDVYDDYKNDSDTEENFLEDEGLYTMEDIFAKYSQYIAWPTYRDYDTDFGDSNTPDELGYLFSDYVDKPVTVLQTNDASDTNYEWEWLIVPDASIPGGWEFVSPKTPLSNVPDMLESIKAFCNRNDCYTNTTTGMHINVSIDGVGMNNLDYIKLVLLLGDNYILDQFSRKFNRFAESSFNMVSDRINNRNFNFQDIQEMKNDLFEFSRNLILNNGSDRNFSVNALKKRIEFRSPGGDYLTILKNNPGKIINTVYRMVVALDAALDKSKYRNEYIKKFYKVLSLNIKPNSSIDFFVRYCAGLITLNQLKTILNSTKPNRKNVNYDNMKLYQVYVELFGSGVRTLREFVVSNQNPDKIEEVYRRDFQRFDPNIMVTVMEDTKWKVCEDRPDQPFKFVVNMYKSFDEIPQNQIRNYEIIPPNSGTTDNEI